MNNNTFLPQGVLHLQSAVWGNLGGVELAELNCSELF